MFVQGSLMYIFDGCFGRILHTGDFRCPTHYMIQIKSQIPMSFYVPVFWEG